MKILRGLLEQIKFRLAKLLACPGIFLWIMASRVTRVSEYGPYEKVELDRNLPLTGVASKLQLLEWLPETDRIWAVSASPHYVQHLMSIRLGEGQQDGALAIVDEKLDCKSLAFWAARVLDKNLYPAVFTFRWMDSEGKMDGHTMCVCRQKDGRVFKIDNWGVSASYSDIREICQEITEVQQAREPIGWALMDRNMNILRCGKEYPSGSVY